MIFKISRAISVPAKRRLKVGLIRLRSSCEAGSSRKTRLLMSPSHRAARARATPRVSCSESSSKCSIRPLGGPGQRHDRRRGQRLRHDAGREPHPLIELKLHLIELVADQPLFLATQSGFLHEPFDEVAIAEIRRDTPPRGMPWKDEAILFHRLHINANGGRTDAIRASRPGILPRLVDLVEGKGRSLVTRVSRLRSLLALAFSLGGRLWRLDDVAGRWLGRGGRILLRTANSASSFSSRR